MSQIISDDLCVNTSDAAEEADAAGVSLMFLETYSVTFLSVDSAVVLLPRLGFDPDVRPGDDTVSACDDGA